MRSSSVRTVSLFAASLLAAAVIVGSCTEPTLPTPALEITPRDPSVLVGGALQFSALNAQGAVSWATGDATVATVVSTGFATTIKRGSVQITATDARGSASTTLTVRARAALVLSTTALTFAQPAGGADSPAQTVQLTDGGDEKVGAVSVSGITYAPGQPTGWLTATLGGSTAPATLTVRSAAGSLPAGTYNATVSVNAVGVAGVDQTVSVTFTVSAPAAIQLSVANLAFSGVRGVGTIAAQNITVINSGGGSLTQLVSSIAYGAGQPGGWLSATLSSMTAPASLLVQPTISSLPDGNYSATISVAAVGAANSPRTVAVTLTVVSNTIVLSSTTVSFAASAGGANPAGQSVNISNSGTGSLTGLSVAVSYAAGQPTGWLTTASLGGTTAPAVLTLGSTVGVLAPGSYTATVAVASPVATNSAQNIMVTLVITNVPIIALSASSVGFDASVGGASPAAQTVTISNGGAATLSGLAAAITYGAGQPAGWLTTATLSTTTAPSTLTLRPTVGVLTAGTYTASVSVLSAVANNSPQTVTVTFVVASSPSIGLSQQNVSLNAMTGGANPAAQTIAITNTGTNILTGLSATIAYQAGQSAGWLSATLNTTTAPASLTLQATVGPLAVGTYTATVSVASPVASNSPQTVTITLVVAASPVIVLSTSTLNFAAAVGASSPPAQSITITNGGTGLLNQLTAAVSYAAGQTTGWLTLVSLTSAQVPTTLTIGTTSAVLPAGTYNATVSVASPVAANSPQLLAVTLVITGVPSIALSSSTATFAANFGAAQPAAQTINITNGGSGSLTGLAVSITYAAGQTAGWLTTASLNTTTAPATLQLRPAVMANGGVYNATVSIASPVAGNSPRTITVTYTVMVLFATQIYPQISTSCVGCHFSSGTTLNPLTDLSSALIAYSNLVNIATNKRQPTYPYPLATTHPIRVVPGNASTSYVLDQVLKVSGAWPMPTSTLSVMPASWIDRFREWINLGAPFN